MDVCATTVTAAFDDLVVEDLTQPPAEECMPGTCICWNDRTAAAA